MSDSERQLADESGQFECDFCGARVESVRRVALERDYDRLLVRHTVRYACPACSERKDREREADAGSPAG